MKKDNKWLKEEIKKVSNNYPTYHDERDDLIKKMVNMHEILELIDQLDKPELPVIPRFMADFIKDFDGNRNDLFRFILRYQWDEDADSDGISGEVIDWIFENDENVLLTLKLIKNDTGYTIEKEKYSVKLGKGYFGGFNELKVTLILNDQPGCMDDVIIYSDKKDAVKIAKEIGGFVEEVTE